jgi:septation ring formation regulator EzrA
MDILEILQTIKEDWPLLAFVFTLGGAWWQGKAWFKKLNETLEKVGTQNGAQNLSLSELHSKIESMNDRLTSLEDTTKTIHEEIHTARTDIAVLQAMSASKSKRKPQSLF